MEPTKYHNLYRTTGVFKYVYKEGNFEIGGRDCNDLKFKLAIKGIKLQEKTPKQNKNITGDIIEHLSSKKIQERKLQEKAPKQNMNFNKKISKPTPSKKHSNDPTPNNKPLRKNIDYIESKEDVDFGKIKYRDLKGGVYETWGPDNSKRARKLREELIR